MNTKTLVLGLLAPLILCLFGCSAANVAVTPDNPGIQNSTDSREPWTWGNWIINISENHDSIEVIPAREGDWHLNVMKFLEKSPCANCIQIGPPQPQTDGTVKFKVTLRHPFPGHAEFTGFDVRGIAIFPATRHWQFTLDITNGRGHKIWGPGFGPAPLYFSWSGDNGASLIDDDGCSYYFWPGFDLGEGYQMPIFKYQEGKYSSGINFDSTVNPYLNFNDSSPRRMFKTTDVIQRTYHVKLPPGPVTFGYAVLAAWVPPTNTPVIDPAQDFPVYANSEDPVDLYFDQYEPMDPNNSPSSEHPTYPFALVKTKYYPHLYQGEGMLDQLGLFSPDIEWDPPAYFSWDGWVGSVSKEPQYWPPVENPTNTYESQLYCLLPDQTNPSTYVNGIYPALFVVVSEVDSYQYPPEGELPVTLRQSVSFKIVDLELQASDG